MTHFIALSRAIIGLSLLYITGLIWAVTPTLWHRLEGMIQ